MDKVKKAFIIYSFHRNASPDATKRLGLWQSEKYAFEKCLYQDNAILDMDAVQEELPSHYIKKDSII
ncbi:hypothetical protein [Bacillus sp. AFS017274]|uniref:hypothetical protein n=1 Tax=Bacillaceae TaxID=186817 RepID=UPI000BF8C87D|nr:hypothetical protein [Bacillus sp. AFS017274]PEZ79664.1 hypothetical protein CN380_17390 [Bacillus sp. AFS017274]